MIETEDQKHHPQAPAELQELDRREIEFRLMSAQRCLKDCLARFCEIPKIWEAPDEGRQYEEHFKAGRMIGLARSGAIHVETELEVIQGLVP